VFAGKHKTGSELDKEGHKVTAKMECALECARSRSVYKQEVASALTLATRDDFASVVDAFRYGERIVNVGKYNEKVLAGRMESLPCDIACSDFSDGLIERIAVRQALASLSSLERSIVIDKDILDMPVKDMVYKYRVSRAYLYRILTRAHESLRNMLS